MSGPDRGSPDWDAREWDRRYTQAPLVWSAAPNRFVVQEVSGLRPGRALDVAAGEGRNALWLAEQGWTVTAVDFSRAAVDKGRALHRRHPQADRLRVDWVVGDVLEHDLGREVHDLALLAYLQLRDEQRTVAVRRSFAALVPGGTFLLVAHHSSNLHEGTGGPQDPEVLYTAEEVLGDLDGERFEVERAERVARPVTTADGEERVAYDALVRLVRTG